MPSCTVHHQLDSWTFPSSTGTSLSRMGAYRRWTFRLDAHHGLGYMSLQWTQSRPILLKPCGQQARALHAHCQYAFELLCD